MMEETEMISLQLLEQWLMTTKAKTLNVQQFLLQELIEKTILEKENNLESTEAISTSIVKNTVKMLRLIPIDQVR